MSKPERYIVCVDSFDGPYDSFDAAEFCARDRVLRFANGEFGAFKGRQRKAVIARIVDVVEPKPSWWDRAFGGGKGAA